jgi:RNA polymerase sigma factor (sigma-70 family)
MSVITRDELNVLLRDAKQTDDLRRRDHAYAVLLKHLRPFLHHLIRKRAKFIHYEDAWSNCQESLMLAVHSFDPIKGSWPTWFGKIVVNRLATYHKYHHRKRQLVTTSIPKLEDGRDVEFESPVGEPRISYEDFRRLWMVIRKMSVRLRRTFILMMNDYDSGQIAAIMNVKPKSADNAVQRVRRLIRRELKYTKGDLLPRYTKTATTGS